MRAKRPQDKSYPAAKIAIFKEHPDLRKAHAGLMSRVFGPALPTMSDRPAWTQIGLFESDGRCSAAADVTIVEMIAGTVRHRVGAVRRVAVDADRRGRGLFLDVMSQAIAWFDAQGTPLVLLYAEHSSLYERFGFRLIPQHSYLGPAPTPTCTTATRRVDIAVETDLVRALLARRAPVSRVAGICGTDDLFLDYVAATPELSLVFAETLDALLAIEQDDGILTLVDVVGPRIRSMAEIVGALTVPSDSVRTLFSPDLLSWRAEPVPEDTGLMARGPLPDRLNLPFMLPPTVEF